MQTVSISENKYFTIKPVIIEEKNQKNGIGRRIASGIKKIWRTFMVEFFAIDIVEKL